MAHRNNNNRRQSGGGRGGDTRGNGGDDWGGWGGGDTWGHQMAAFPDDLPRIIPPSCESCTQQPAEFGCAECEAKLCSACWPQVHRFGALLRHEKGSLAASLSQYCPTHKGRIIDYMCVDDRCANKGELMCHLCKDTAPHKQHQSQVLIEVFDDKRRQLQSAIDLVDECVVFAGGVLDQVNTIDHQLRPNPTTNSNPSSSSASSSSASSNNRDKAVKRINAHFDELAAQVEARRAVLISEVDGVVGRKAGKLEEQRREVEEYLATSKSAVHAASEVMSSSNAHEFFSSFWRVHEQLEQVSTRRLHGSAVVTSLVDVRLGGDEVVNAVRDHGAVIDDGDVSQPRQLACGPRVVKLIPHSLMFGGDGVAGSVPSAVRELHGDKVQLHCVRWNSARCHAGLEVSSGGCTVKSISNDGGYKNCFGVASNASDGFVGGVHFFSIRVANPGKDGNIMVGFSDGKLSTTEDAITGYRGAHNGDLGACLHLNDGYVCFPETGGKRYAPCATGVGGQICSMGVLLDLEACRVSFFIDGANLHNNGPFPDYPVPAGKTWFPFASLVEKNSTITSETLN